MRARWCSLLLAGCTFHAEGAPATHADAAAADATADARGNDAVPVDAPAGSPRIIDHATADGEGTTVTATLTQTASQGDVVLVLVGWEGSDSVSGVADTRGATFGSLATVDGCALYAARVKTATAPDDVTATFTQATGNLILIAEYTSVATSGSGQDGGTALELTNGSTITTGAITTAHAGDTLVGLADSDTMPGAGSGYTLESSSQFTAIEDRRAAEPGSYTASITFGDAQQACLSLVALEAD